MSAGRPTKAERDRWAELLGDEGRRARRARVRIGAIVFVVACIAVGVAFAGLVRGVGGGGCPAPGALRAYWAQPKSKVSPEQTAQAVADTLRCVQMTGKTREAIQAELGDWTAVSEYRPTRRDGRASFLVWSNGNRSGGVRVDFNGRGVARSAQEYRP